MYVFVDIFMIHLCTGCQMVNSSIYLVIAIQVQDDLNVVRCFFYPTTGLDRRMWRLPNFLNSQEMKVVGLSALSVGVTCLMI